MYTQVTPLNQLPYLYTFSTTPVHVDCNEVIKQLLKRIADLEAKLDRK